MNLGTKTFRAVASAALGLTMMAGIGTSMVSADTVEVSVTANGGTNTCTLAMLSTSVSLGTVDWNGSSYTKNTTMGTVSGTVNATGQSGNRECTVSYGVTDFTNGSVSLFSVADLQGSVDGTNFYAVGASGGPISVGQVPMGGLPGSAQLRINPSAAPNSSAPAGTYESTITITLGSVNI